MQISDLPEKIHRYRVLAELGRGSMGRVYLAEDPNIGRRLALKVLSPRRMALGEQGEELKERFRAERQILARLEHPYVARLYEGGTTAGGRPYLVMEYVDGEPISRLLRKHGPLPLPLVLRVAQQVAAGLSEAHRHGVIHRDLKAENVMVTATGEARILDFGLAKMKDRLASSLTRQGAVLGTIVGGSIAGPAGAAAGALVLSIYGAITGEVPLSNSGGGRRNEQGRALRMERELESELERELSKQDTLRSEIEHELKRQEALLRQIDIAEGKEPSATGGPPELADPRIAPLAPEERDAPLSIYAQELREIPAGAWGNEQPLSVIVRSLDADEDGAPEEVRYYDEQSDVVLRKEVDADYDGRVDSWTLYKNGAVAELQNDVDGDGKPDEWKTYGPDKRLVRREVDRDADGARDAFYIYRNGGLSEENHDADGDGQVDRIVYYDEQRKLLRSEEDSDSDGRMDTWTEFAGKGGREFIARIERDSDSDGKRDTFETYGQVQGRTALSLREEDRNGDGEIDVRSIYENGKLKSREAADPELLR